MNRLQFIHRDGVFKGFSREQAIEYIKKLTNRELAVNLGESLIGEPLAVTYLDGNNNKQVLLCIGVSGETENGVFEPYHIIDSAKFNEDILALSGISQTLREDLENEILRATEKENNLQTELDTTQVGAGLNTDGSYLKTTSASYIKNVNSLNEADVKLDTELSRVEKARKDVTGQQTDTYIPNQSFVARPIKYIESATSLNDADVKLDQAIQTLDNENIKNVVVNDISGTVTNNIASVNISGNSIPIGEYENYDGKVVRPHPIHNNYSLLDSVKQLDVNFLDFAEKEEAERKGIHLVKVTTGLDTNIKEAYDLVDRNGNPVSGSSRILIYKDSSLFQAYLGHVDDELESYTGTTIIPGTGDTALCFIYENMGGLYELVKINIESFLEESEFKDGLKVDNHKVYVKIDDLSEGFLTVSPEGIKLSGVQSAISTKVNEERLRAEESESALRTKLNNVQEGSGLNEDGTYKQHNIYPDDLANFIYSANSLSNADFILDANLYELSGVVHDLSASTIEKINEEIARATTAEQSLSGIIIQNEYVVSKALNELNNNINSEIDRATLKENTIENNLNVLSSTVQTFSASTNTKLNSEIDRATTKDTELQTELDTTQVGAGLNTDGTYIHEHDAHYINNAISLHDADKILDTNIFNLNNSVHVLSASTIEKINEEVERAINTENAISAAVIENEFVISRTLNDLNGQISTEVNRATFAEQTISGNLITLSSRTNSELSRIDVKIDNEISRATSVENELNNKIKSSTVFSNDKTITVISGETGTDLSINIDGVTIGKDNNGVLSTKLTVKKLAEPSSINIKDEYVLVDSNDVIHGESIKVYKDTSLQSVELVTIADKEYLRFTYLLADGTTSIVDIDVSSFISENEFKDGFKVENSKVYVLVDPTSENFLSVSSNGVKISGVQNAINSAVNTETTRATSAETILSNSISALENKTIASAITLHQEITAATNSLTDLIISETTRATTAENGLNTSINNESIARSEAITNERTRATAAEQNIITAYTAAISNEITNRIAADDTLRELITDYTASTEARISAFDNRLNSEISRATNAENSISGNVSTLSGSVININTTLTNALNVETTRATNAEQSLSGAVSTLSNNATSSANTLSIAISGETTRATNAENSISGAVTTLSGSVTTLSGSTKSAIDNINSRIDDITGKTISGKDSIRITKTDSDTKISLTINDNDKVLSQDDSGLYTTLKLDIAGDGKTVYLKGKNDVTISSIDTTKFVKDGMIDTVTFDTNTKTLNFVFNTDAGKTPIAIPMESLVDTYEVSASSVNYLQIENFKIGAKVDVSNGLAGYNTVSQLRTDASTSANTLNAAIGTETTRATAAEESLSAIIIQNEYVISQAFNEVNNKIENLVTSANTISGDVVQLRTDASTSANTLNAAIGTETTRATNVESALSEKINTVSGGVNTVKSDLNSLSVSASTSANTLNEKINTLSSNTITSCNTLDIKINNLSNSASTSANTLNEKINTTNSNVTLLENRVSALESENSGLTTEINTLKNTVTELTNTVNGLTNRIAALEAIINNLDIYSSLVSILNGTTNEISVVGDDTNKKITIGFDNTTVIGNDSDSF